MTEFSLSSFVERLRGLMYDNFPNLPNRGFNKSGSFKHGAYNEEIKDVAFEKNPTIVLDENSMCFEIGNDYAEEHYPYYHILQDSQYIRKRDKGTDKTKGSQAKVEKLSARDYGRVSWNGKTYTKEYSRNVRGSRNRLDKVSHWITNSKGEREFINRESNTYLNVHYKYIDRMLDDKIVDFIALEYNMKSMRKKDTGLKEEYESQNNIIEILNSFEGE